MDSACKVTFGADNCKFTAATSYYFKDKSHIHFHYMTAPLLRPLISGPDVIPRSEMLIPKALGTIPSSSSSMTFFQYVTRMQDVFQFYCPPRNVSGRMYDHKYLLTMDHNLAPFLHF